MIRITHRPALSALAVLAVLTLAACGSDENKASQSGDAAAPIPAPLTDAQKTSVLASLPGDYAKADLDNGRRVFARCRSCHTITPGGPNMTGPNLYGVIGRKVGIHPGFRYSKAVEGAGFVWDVDRVDHWLENPRTFLAGNKMTFPGLPDATDRRDVVAFVATEGAATVP